MAYYAGLDVSLEETAVCVVDGRGSVVAEFTAPSDPEALVARLKSWRRGLKRVGLEAGGLSPWLHQGLCAAGLPAVCLETRRMKAYAKANPVKTDRQDAALIAQMVRTGFYKAVHVKSATAHALRLALTNRQVVLRQARQLQHKVRGDLRPFGIKLGQVGSGGFAARVKQKLAGRPELWALVKPLLELRAAQLEQVRAYDRELRRLAKSDAVCQRLMTVPGVGPMNALAFRATIDRPERFTRSGAVPAVLGLTPRIEQSGERERYGAITKAGDGLLRSLLFEAANALLTRQRSWCSLKRWGLQVAKRRGMNRARVAVARRLAIVLFAIWRDGSTFRWSHSEPQAA